MILKPIQQVSEYVEKFVKLCLKSVTNALYIIKKAADKAATADQVNDIQLLAYSFIKNWFFLSNQHLQIALILECKTFQRWVVYFLTGSLVLSRSFTNSLFTLYSSLRKRASLVLPCWTLNPTIDGRPFCIASAISLYFVHCIVENYLLNIGKSAKIKKCIITEILRFISEQRKRVSTNYQKSPRRYTRCTSSEIQRLL